MIAAVARKGLSLLAAVLFSVLGVLTYVDVPPIEECPGGIECHNGIEKGQSSETEKTAAALAALSSGELDKAADGVSGQRGLVPAGDTCGMRRPNVMPALSRTVRTAFAAASMAASPAARFEILDHLEAIEPAATWRIRLEKSEVARRAGDFARASDEADAALALDPPGTCISDAWFSKAVVSEGDARTDALIAAVESDTGNYNAWARLAIDLMARMDAGLDPAACDAVAARIVEAIVYLDKLAKTDAQLARLERLANAVSRSTSPSRALLLAMVQERTTRTDRAADIYSSLTSGSGAVCAAPIELVARNRLAALQVESKP